MVEPSGHRVDSLSSGSQKLSEWQIRPEDMLHRGRMVGQGTYGTVYKAEVRLHGEDNAPSHDRS